MKTNPLTLGRKANPTRKHRAAIWECMLGTVYAMNDAGEVRYFDYKWDEAVAFAGVTPERDPRTAKPTCPHPDDLFAGVVVGIKRDHTIRATQPALWVLR